jgi:hypothetical protein
MASHPNKHIRAAVEYAVSHGWTLRKAGSRAHVWGACIVHRVIERVVLEQFIPLLEFPRTMPRISVGRWIAVPMCCKSC